MKIKENTNKIYNNFYHTLYEYIALQFLFNSKPLLRPYVVATDLIEHQLHISTVSHIVQWSYTKFQKQTDALSMTFNYGYYQVYL